MKAIIKMELYDKFRCIADKCDFTCCAGWDITVDPDTLYKWKSNIDAQYFKKNIKEKKFGKKTVCFLKMDAHKKCPFLNETGLCNIVTSYGDEFLSDTCRTFPRVKKTSGNMEEYLITCACPSVVDLIRESDGQINYFRPIHSTVILSLGYQLREMMILLMQNSTFTIKDRILFIFHLLLTVKDDNISDGTTISEDDKMRYRDSEYLGSLAKLWSTIELEQTDVLTEINELFLDIVMNYRKEKQYKPYLQEISKLAEDIAMEEIIAEWDEYKLRYNHYDQFLENYLVNQLLCNCNSDDIDEMILAFQMLVTEFVMVRYSVFLRWMDKRFGHDHSKQGILDEKSQYDKNEMVPAYGPIRDFIVIYSRIIGYNPTGMKEFWEESFDDAVWEMGYLLLLIS